MLYICVLKQRCDNKAGKSFKGQWNWDQGIEILRRLRDGCDADFEGFPWRPSSSSCSTAAHFSVDDIAVKVWRNYFFVQIIF
jgi:hypothetical protein